MYVVSAVAVVLFFGGWYTGIPPVDEIGGGRSREPDRRGNDVIITKAFLLVCVQMWIRWTLPRIRLDQMMDLCLKYLLPISLILLILVALWQGMWPDGQIFGLVMIVAMVLAFLKMRFGMVRAVASRSKQSTELPVLKV